MAKARAMRNFIAHDYDDIDRDLVWEAVCASAPDLANAVSDLANAVSDLADDTQQSRNRPAIEL